MIVFIFCKAEVDQCQTILKIIIKYRKTAGQEFNFDKLSVMFGKNVPNQTKEQLKNPLGISKDGRMRSYLGIPKSLGGSKSKIFNYVRERLTDQINGRSAKFL